MLHVAGMLIAPESPRWLYQKQRKPEAEAAAQKLWGPTGPSQLTEGTKGAALSETTPPLSDCHCLVYKDNRMEFTDVLPHSSLCRSLVGQSNSHQTARIYCNSMLNLLWTVCPGGRGFLHAFLYLEDPSKSQLYFYTHYFLNASKWSLYGAI